MTTKGFLAARDFKLTFGKHAGKTLDEVATLDSGLLYLDWLRGEKVRHIPTRMAVATYLADETIKKDLAELMKDDASNRRSYTDSENA